MSRPSSGCLDQRTTKDHWVGERWSIPARLATPNPGWCFVFPNRSGEIRGTMPVDGELCAHPSTSPPLKCHDSMWSHTAKTPSTQLYYSIRKFSTSYISTISSGDAIIVFWNICWTYWRMYEWCVTYLLKYYMKQGRNHWGRAIRTSSKVWLTPYLWTEFLLTHKLWTELMFVYEIFSLFFVFIEQSIISRFSCQLYTWLNDLKFEIPKKFLGRGWAPSPEPSPALFWASPSNRALPSNRGVGRLKKVGGQDLW